MAGGLVAISFAPVAAKRADDDIWEECLLPDTLDQKVVDRFSNYVHRCAAGKERGYREVIFEDENGKFLEKRIKELLKLPIDKLNKRRREITQELAARLCQFMSAAPGGNTKAGAIFVIQSEFDGKKSVAILKLDLNEAEVVALKATKDVRQILYTRFERALPSEAKYFRKGVYYPSPSDGDALSGQHDNWSIYWERFVGVRPVREGHRAAQAIVETIRETAREDNKPLTDAKILEIVEKVEMLEAPTPAEVARKIRDAGNFNKRPANIQEKLEGKLAGASVADFSRVKFVEYEFRDALKMKVPSELVKKKLVEVHEEGRDVIIRIKQSGFRTSEVFEND